MDFGILSPDINSGRMYSGAGSGPMLAAAAAWDRLAAELRSAADAYSSVISGLTAAWQGPSSWAMTAAAAPYAAWMTATAAQAEQTATQARDAATAYEAAFAATVPPQVVAANRARLASLVTTNAFGQNTPAIAATEARYGEMWAQDAAAMYGYAGQSATASQVTPFTSPPRTTEPGGPASQSAAVAQATGTSAGTNARSTLARLMSAAPSSLQSLATPGAADPAASSALSLISSDSPLTMALEAYELGGPVLLPARNALIAATAGMAMATRGFQTGALPVTAAAESGLTAGLASAIPGSAGPGGAGAPVAATLGRGGLVGALSVPPSWAAATPAVRLAAAVLQGTSPAAAALADSGGTLFGQMALAGLAGGALGGAVPRVVTATGGRIDRPNHGKDNTADGKDGKSAAKLERVLAELSQKPESVQHWHTDKANLDSLLERLATKPGVHAVHVSSSGKKDPAAPKPRWSST